MANMCFVMAAVIFLAVIFLMIGYDIAASITSHLSNPVMYQKQHLQMVWNGIIRLRKPTINWPFLNSLTDLNTSLRMKPLN